MTFRLVFAATALTLVAAAADAQDSSASRDSLRVRHGAEFAIPLVSVFLPGAGQYIYRAPVTGLAYTAVFAGGFALIANGTSGDSADVPRSSRNQFADVGALTSQSASWLSSWDAFHRAVPAMQQQGKYRFLTKHEGLPQLLSAPFDYRFLGRKTTWIDLAHTGAITALILSTRKSNETHYPFRAQEAAYAFSMSANAGIGEEAWFRGYLLPMMYQKTGGKFWFSNTTQAALFMAGHGINGFTLIDHFPWALYEGWLVRRNDWSVRESIFHHVWYDVAVITAIAIAEEKPATLRIRFPSIPF